MTVRAREAQKLTRTVKNIQTCMRKIHTSDDVMRAINQGIAQTSSKATKAEKISKIFSKCLKKNERTAEKNLKFLQGLKDFHDQSVSVLNLKQIMHQLKKQPDSEEAWGRFYGYVEKYAHDEAGLKILRDERGTIEDFLEKGITMAHGLQTAYAEEGSIGIETLNTQDPGVEIAKRMEDTLTHVLEQIKPVSIRISPPVVEEMRIHQIPARDPPPSSSLKAPSAAHASRAQQAKYEKNIKILKDAEYLTSNLDKEMQKIKSDYGHLYALRAVNISWKNLHPDLELIKMTDEELREKVGERPQGGIELEIYEELCKLYQIKKQMNLVKKKLGMS